MAKKPSNLIYGVDDRPSFYEIVVLGLEHISVMTLAFVFPVIIVQESGGSMQEAAVMIQMSMIAGGLGTILQSIKNAPMGSGYLCPQVCGPSFLSASILAGKTAGLGAVFAGTFFGAFFEAVFSRVIKRLRQFFPPEVTGTVVAMVGITVIPFAMTRFFGLNETSPTIRAHYVIIAVTTLGVICAVTIWGKKKLRLYNIIIGMMFGYLLSFVFGVFTTEQTARLASAHYIDFPVPIFHKWTVRCDLVIPFVVASLCSSLKTIGDLVTCQKINDPDWKHMDMDSMKGGLLADAAGAMSAGLLGGMAQSSSSSNVALSLATGATSRIIAWSVGLLLIALAFFPKFATIFVIMPAPVIGATLVFAVSFMIVVGLQIITSRMLDARKMLVVGISIILGLSVDMVPGVYAGVPSWIAPVFSSSLSLATISVVILNILFRIGIANKKTLVLKPGVASGQAIYNFTDTCGREWGARNEIIARATRILTELFESCVSSDLAKSDIVVDMRFDEFNLDLKLSYHGMPLDFSADAPCIDDIVNDDESLRRLSTAIIRKTVDRMKCEEFQGKTILRIHLDH
ncbi:nucleobase:cation symporter-2, NCS2 family [Desulfocicer vacuolatum DSM 3385]|uniref:Nucleobase:cation symporter-2, NCS2 family n=1 Tax=Desulfocicer vacuolatum DSM 3385 TaxID=1121400 RepID=A0A1W2A6R5_9BACT|nr:solute carrier family 23 protein [Desulfocicer vacuolatum]SMC56395.1 nucleobase:cation symporter-2, NCS2 family [Desulfocicer vacuolatum DSM 3385]